MKCTVPSKRRVRASWRAAPISMLVWPSWPQPWCTPVRAAGVCGASQFDHRQRVHVGAQADSFASRCRS
jgi:hypothetical protein